jgi:hypothetical protein
LHRKDNILLVIIQIIQRKFNQIGAFFVLSGTKVVLFCESAKDFRRIIVFLEENNTIPPDSDDMVLFGLCHY